MRYLIEIEAPDRYDRRAIREALAALLLDDSKLDVSVSLPYMELLQKAMYLPEGDPQREGLLLFLKEKGVSIG